MAFNFDQDVMILIGESVATRRNWDSVVNQVGRYWSSVKPFLKDVNYELYSEVTDDDPLCSENSILSGKYETLYDAMLDDEWIEFQERLSCAGVTSSAYEFALATEPYPEPTTQKQAEWVFGLSKLEKLDTPYPE